MRMVTPAIGSPETGLFTYGYRALSAHYGMPCRSGGSLTDSSTADMQAGIESTYSILSASIAGIDYVLQSCGILESFNSLCFEKIIIDEENIRMAKRYVSGFEITDETIAFDIIKQVGSEGTYITSDHTFANFRNSFIQAKLYSKVPYENWEMQGKKDVFEAAKEVVEKRLEGYKKPELTKEQAEYLKGFEVTV